MSLPTPPPTYTPRHWAERNRQISSADMENLKRNRDAEIGAGRLILTDVTTGARYSVFVDSGVLTIAAI